ncbi:uncharacterized protein B0H18DRAFT_953560 [Fomitopsis serialis]|uniref:uncharacterized protein n=1 Tax=Fomitopsis serialis TaxID=139415 RepID=UPI002008A0D8|nr:uncharacterized protein B0H18DRAFT_953560 [Neoantrodia serialis]KAH9929376.1 hypothetical protein B0H18DRAFT_953560 [Neoantrodia serialis]
MPVRHRLGRAIVLVPLLVAICILAGYTGTSVFFARTHDAPLVQVAALAKRHAAHLSEDGLQFEILLSAPVAMSIGDTVRYQLNDPFAEEEYARLMPSGGHLVYVHDAGRPRGDAVEEPGPRAYTVTLFHQLKCLDIIRRELTDDSLETPTIRAAHCMNYLRQMIICRVNTIRKIWIP